MFGKVGRLQISLQELERNNIRAEFYPSSSKARKTTANTLGLRLRLLRLHQITNVAFRRHQILASCDQGILICERRARFNTRLYACKPATGQWQALPNPKLRYETVSIAVVVVRSHPLRYLIARLYCTEMHDHCEIFDSKSWRWKKMDYSVTAFDPPVTTAGRFVHWLTWSNEVVTLDVKRRCFVESWTLPERVRYKYNEKKLVEYKGGLGLMCQGKDAEEMELWANREKKMVVGVKADLDHPTFKHFCNNDVVFVTTADAEGGAFYNLSNYSVITAFPP